MNILLEIYKKLLFANQLSILLGENFFSKIKLYYLTLWIPVKKRLGLRTDSMAKIKLRKNNRKFNLFVGESGDLDSLKEIFIDDEYTCQIETSPEIIFDVGSNAGISSIFFRLKYPDAKIYCFEPSPKSFKKLKRNVEQFDNIYIFNVAVTGKDGKVKFYASPVNSLFSSLVQLLPDQPSIEVEGKTLDTLMNELDINKIDLLKFDIEGVELEVFKSFRNLSQVKFLIGELHLNLIEGRKEDFLNVFSNYNVELDMRSSNI